MHPMQNLARPIAALARARNQLLNLVERKVTEISACGNDNDNASSDVRRFAFTASNCIRNPALKAGRRIEG